MLDATHCITNPNSNVISGVQCLLTLTSSPLFSYLLPPTVSGSHDHSLKTHIAVLKGFSTIHCTEAANLIPRTDVWAVLTNGLGSPWLCVPSSPPLSGLSLSLSLPLPAALQLYPGSNNSTFLTHIALLTHAVQGMLFEEYVIDEMKALGNFAESPSTRDSGCFFEFSSLDQVFEVDV